MMSILSSFSILLRLFKETRCFYVFCKGQGSHRCLKQCAFVGFVCFDNYLIYICYFHLSMYECFLQLLVPYVPCCFSWNYSVLTTQDLIQCNSRLCSSTKSSFSKAAQHFKGTSKHFWILEFLQNIFSYFEITNRTHKYYITNSMSKTTKLINIMGLCL
jgi:hypothetical protein